MSRQTIGVTARWPTKTTQVSTEIPVPQLDKSVINAKAIIYYITVEIIVRNHSYSKWGSGSRRANHKLIYRKKLYIR